MQIKLLVEGGSMKPGPALSQKLGPTGINVNQVIQKVNESTKNFNGMKVPVELDVDPSSGDIKVKVFSPPVSELIKKELGIEKGSGHQNKIQVANASIEQIVSVAKTKLPNLLCNDLRSAIKTVVGSCASLGILIENKPAVEIEEDIEKGIYDKEINNEIVETSEDKKNDLKNYFSKVQDSQKEVKQQLEAKKDEKKK